MQTEQKKYLDDMSKKIRYYTVDQIGRLGVGHIGGCLSIAELLSVLYFEQMNIDANNDKMEGRDRIVFSKGHAGPAVYAALALKGYFGLDWLETLNKPNTKLPSHCDMNKTPGIDMTAGSLGQGISCAVGIAKASKILKDNATIYCVVGDGESQEGQVWEASMTAAQYKLDNFILFLDYNKYQIDGGVDDICSLIDPVKKWEAFGFDVIEINGHDVEQISNSINAAKANKNRKPKCIVLNTVKGKGVTFTQEAKATNHNMVITKEQWQTALNELR